jgi:hypothetical protein
LIDGFVLEKIRRIPHSALGHSVLVTVKLLKLVEERTKVKAAKVYIATRRQEHNLQQPCLIHPKDTECLIIDGAAKRFEAIPQHFICLRDGAWPLGHNMSR